ncbi:cell adhesion molecule DSCAM-like [Uloborus diversus]|uniref:cell adhesion molecule DSCAM-like n=1 Tax=Uloborus diversus TaxID=327109 RepID=UPI0024095E7A|nr:cell adhesion molecule DSCAM-like [Uloborus diversus]
MCANAYIELSDIIKKLVMKTYVIPLLMTFHMQVTDTKEAPIIQPFSFPENVRIGHTLSIACTVMKGKPPFEFSWQKNNKILKRSVSINTQEKVSTLLIDPVTKESTGNYTCIVSNVFGKNSFSSYLSVRAPPSWITEPNDRDTVEGLKISFECKASGFPFPKITWRRIGSMDKENDISIVQGHMNGTLTFAPTFKGHEGKYMCEIDNGAGEPLSKVVSLTVHDLPKIQPFQFPQNVKLGEKTSITCIVKTDHSSLTYEWQKDGNPLKPSRNINIESSKLHSTLIINPVEDGSVGNYTCIAKSKSGKDIYSTFLLVKAPPTWIKEPESIEVVEGQIIRITCAANGYPMPKMAIIKEDTMNDISLSTTKVLYKENGNITLNFEPVQKLDDGKYLCRAKNDVGDPIERKFAILVNATNYKIQPFIFPTTVREGESTKVMCSVTTEEKPLAFKWFKNQLQIKSSDRREISHHSDYSLLKIKTISSEDSGNYTCVVRTTHGTLNYTAELLVEAPVQWLSEPVDQEIKLGESVKFSCSAKGFPTPRIQWLKLSDNNRVNIITHSRIKIEHGSLHLSDIKIDDSGVYVCSANNGVGETLEKEVLLSVIDAPEINPFHLSPKLKIGDIASLHCSVIRGQTPLRFEWYKNGNLIKYPSNQIQMNDKFSNLVIDPIKGSSAGNYTCAVKNDFGTTSYSVFLVVRAPPFWIQEPENKETTEGSAVSLSCYAGGMPSPEITWKKIGSAQKQEVSFMHKNKENINGSLLLNPVLKEHEGTYLCEVNNEVGETLQKSASLVVYDAPKISPFAFPPMVQIQEKTSIACFLKQGTLPLTFRWSKDNRILSETGNIKIKTLDDMSALTIDPVSPKDSGNYSCLVSNPFGKNIHSAVLKVEAPPHWRIEPKDIEAMEGDEIFLFCQADGLPLPKYTWTKINGRETTVLKQAVNGNFTIQRVNTQHAGEYVCNVENGIGEILRKSSKLVIHEKSPKIQPFSIPEKLTEGEEVKLGCLVRKGSKPFHFKWFKGKSELKNSVEYEIISKDEVSFLTVKKLTGYSSGNFTCRVSNSFGDDSYAVSLVVTAPPQWVTEPFGVEGLLASKVTLECFAAGYPLPEITWSYLKGSGEKMPLISKNGSLVFESLKADDEGEYECKAFNNVGASLEKVISLSVIVPARFDDKFTVITVKKGDSASLRCEAVGDQPLSVNWKRDGNELRKINGGRYEIFETLTPKGLKSELVLREADRVDGQLYTCLTENPYGKDERNIKLLVMEVPATPLDLKVQEVWSRSVSVSWSPPYTGNSPITKYVLQYWRDAGRHRLEEKVVSSAQTSALIKDLHPGINYGLAIVAENTVGRGEPSDTISFSTGEEEPSGSPMDVNVDVKGTASLLVTWKNPPKSEWNGKLKGYYVGYKIIHDSSHPYSFKTVDYVPGGVQEHMITSLRKDTEYSIIVKAFNTAGSGPPSQEVVVRTLGGDLPQAPIVFVVATSETSIKIQWRTVDNKMPVSGHAIHYRKKGEAWQRVALTSSNENSYSLSGLQSGALYQLYVTATSDYGEGDPSDVVTVKTYAGHDNIVLFPGTQEPQMMMDMSLLIPVGASLLAVIVVIIAVCVWVLKAKSRRNLERAIQEDKRYIYAAATQRYVDIDKTRSLPAYHDPALIHFPTPYATVPMGDDISEGGGNNDPNQEMKAFISQNMKDRPLPKPGTLKKQRDSHIYDSPQ